MKRDAFATVKRGICLAIELSRSFTYWVVADGRATHRDGLKAVGLRAGGLHVADAVRAAAVHVHGAGRVGRREAAAIGRRGGRPEALWVVIHHCEINIAFIMKTRRCTGFDKISRQYAYRNKKSSQEEVDIFESRLNTGFLQHRLNLLFFWLH